MDGYGEWIWMDLDGYWWIWMDMDGFGWIWMDLDGFGWIWMDMDGLGWIWMDMDGLGWRRRVDLDGFGPWEPEHLIIHDDACPDYPLTRAASLRG